MNIDPAWVGIFYFGVGLLAVFSVQNLLKVVCGLLVMSWGLVLFLVLFGSVGDNKQIDGSSAHAAAFLIMLSGLAIYVVGLSLLLRRRIQGKALDESMKELRH